MIQPEALGDCASHRLADDDCGVDLQGVHEARHVVGEVPNAVSGGRFGRLAMPAQRGHALGRSDVDEGKLDVPGDGHALDPKTHVENIAFRIRASPGAEASASLLK